MLNIKQVATELGVNPKTVQRWIQQEKLRAFKKGPVVRVKREWLELFIRQHSQ